MDHTIEIAVAEGSFGAHIVRPGAAGEPAPVVVVLQEIFGVNPGIRSIAREMAGHGFIALCPDLFWRSQPGLSMNEADPGHQERGFALYLAYDFDQGVGDVLAAIAAARTLEGASGKVGVMGYCLGGLLTFLAAASGAGAAADAAVAYYGGGTERFLERAARIDAPLLMHLAEEDEYIDNPAQAAIRAALAASANVTVHGYPGQSHAFARPGGAHFDRAAADLAWRRTLDFLRLHLG